MKNDRMTAARDETVTDARSGSAANAPESPGFGYARGACPSLAAPMMTGDGLLVRLRPAVAGQDPFQLLRDLV